MPLFPLPSTLTRVVGFTAALRRRHALPSRANRADPATLGRPRFFLLSLATLPHFSRFHFNSGGNSMNSIVYIVGLVVIIGAILAFLGLR